MNQAFYKKKIKALQKERDELKKANGDEALDNALATIAELQAVIESAEKAKKDHSETRGAEKESLKNEIKTLAERVAELSTLNADLEKKIKTLQKPKKRATKKKE